MQTLVTMTYSQRTSKKITGKLHYDLFLKNFQENYYCNPKMSPSRAIIQNEVPTSLNI